jgi:hypothetical protein
MTTTAARVQATAGDPATIAIVLLMWRISMGGALRSIGNFPGGVKSHFQQNKFAQPKQDRSAQARSDHQLRQSQGG